MINIDLNYLKDYKRNEELMHKIYLKQFGGDEMIYYDNGYKMSTTKVHYIEETEGEVIKFIPESKEYWQDFHDRGIIELKGFIEDDNYTKEQRDRLDRVNRLRIPEGTPLVEEYILNNKFEKEYEDEEGNKHIIKVSEENPIYIFKLSEENSRLKVELEQQKSTNQINMMGIVDVNNRLRKLEAN